MKDRWLWSEGIILPFLFANASSRYVDEQVPPGCVAALIARGEGIKCDIANCASGREGRWQISSEWRHYPGRIDNHARSVEWKLRYAHTAASCRGNCASREAPGANLVRILVRASRPRRCNEANAIDVEVRDLCESINREACMTRCIINRGAIGKK